MALINCPECNRQVSDKAESCPNCGYPLQNRSVIGINADVLSGHRWKVQSETLGTGRTLVADFTKDGKFTGILQVPPGDIEMRSQQINGKWHVAQPLLFLAWDWFWSLAGTNFHEEIPIEISSILEEKLEGVDKWVRMWIFERL